MFRNCFKERFLFQWEIKRHVASFQFESLSIFYFGCRRIGHGFKDCSATTGDIMELSEDDLPYSVALKAKSNLSGKENVQLGISGRKTMM